MWMDPNTLETLGYTDLNGKMSSQTFTAHPKVDPETGQMIAFGYAAKGLCTASIAYHEISPEGELTKEILHRAAVLLDDSRLRGHARVCGVPHHPADRELGAAESGLPHFGYDSSKDTYLGVLRRGGEAASKPGPCAGLRRRVFNAHIMNAFNEGEKIHIDLPVSATNGMPFFPDVSGAPWNPQDAAPILTRWTIDMGSQGEGFERSRSRRFRASCRASMTAIT